MADLTAKKSNHISNFATACVQLASIIVQLKTLTDDAANLGYGAGGANALQDGVPAVIDKTTTPPTVTTPEVPSDFTGGNRYIDAAIYNEMLAMLQANYALVSTVQQGAPTTFLAALANMKG